MSEHATEQVYPGAPHGVAASHHPTAGQYIVVAVILTVLTIGEILVYYIPFLQPVLVPLLMVLSFLKFILVAGYYMHLHFDAWVFFILFFFPLSLACLILASLTFLVGALSHRPGP